MRPHPLLAFALLLLAGCTDGGGEGEPTPTDGGTPVPDSPVPGHRSGASVTYELGHNLTYESSLVRFAVVAEGNATVTLDAGTSTPTIAFQSGCSALAAYVQDPGADAGDGTTGLYLVAWSQNANVYAEATVAGQRVPLVPEQFPQDSGSGAVALAGILQANLTAGQRVVVEMGGSGSHGDAAPSFRANATVTGPARVERLPDAPLACGTGARAAEGSTVGLSTYLVTSSVGGSIEFASKEATTFLAVARDLTGSNEARYRFLGGTEQPLPDEVALSSPEAGTAAILFDRWADPGGMGWLFADTHWPIA